MKQFNKELKKEIVRLHIEDGRTLNSLAAEYKISKASVSNWIKQYRNECQSNPQSQKDLDTMELNRKLQKENAELKKEIEFLKKAAAFFAKEIG